MGLFDFIKDAGARLTGIDVSGDSTSQEDLEKQRAADRRVGDQLTSLVDELGLPVEEPKVLFGNGVARVFGKVGSQADREKIVLAVGNTQGVAQVDDQMELVAAEPEPAATMYTVQRGDTLSKIAKEHYGSAGKYPVIFEANKPMLDNPDRIYPGQVLRIPPLG